MAVFVKPGTQPFAHNSVTAQPYSPRLRADFPSSEDPYTIKALVLPSNWASIDADSPLLQRVSNQDIENGDKIERDTRVGGNLTTMSDTGRLGIDGGVGIINYRILDKSFDFAPTGWGSMEVTT